MTHRDQQAFTTEDGLILEARWNLPEEGPDLVVVLCHPHPLMGGSMDVPLIRTIAGRLSDLGAAVMRFNFRGVGNSEGAWGGGTAEIEDVAAATRFAERTRPDSRHAIAGWSFGAHTALRWQARANDTRPYAGVAPPTTMTGGIGLPAPEALPPAHRLFVIGDRDQFTPAADLEQYAERARARFEMVAETDHFFYFRERQVADLIADHFTSKPE